VDPAAKILAAIMHTVKPNFSKVLYTPSGIGDKTR